MLVKAARDKLHSFFSANYLYLDRTAKLPAPGAEAYAFALQMLPLLDWKGPGDIVQRNMQISSPQLYVAKSVTPAGIPGIAAGQIFAGNLVDLTG